jgi:hypothetical protein
MWCAHERDRSSDRSSAGPAANSITARSDDFAESCFTSAQSNRQSSVDPEQLEHPI